MMMRVGMAAAVMAAVVATGAGADTVTSLRYVCERGTEVEASYLNVGEKSFAVVMAEGQQMAMELVKGGAGARYVSIDKDAPYSWWTENDRGILSYGRSNAESVLFQDCHER